MRQRRADRYGRAGRVAVLIGAVVPAAAPANDAGHVFPQRISAQDLLLSCASSTLTGTGRERRRFCHGFVSGVEEGVRLASAGLSGAVSPPFCVPAGASARDMAEAFVAYAARRQADQSRPAAAVVVAALETGFPCP